MCFYLRFMIKPLKTGWLERVVWRQRETSKGKKRIVLCLAGSPFVDMASYKIIPSKKLTEVKTLVARKKLVGKLSKNNVSKRGNIN